MAYAAMERAQLVFVEPDSLEWHRMWRLACPGGDRVEENPRSGECWQYMGSTDRRGLWEHEFRHRDHPSTNKRLYKRVEASAAWVGALPN